MLRVLRRKEQGKATKESKEGGALTSQSKQLGEVAATDQHSLHSTAINMIVLRARRLGQKGILPARNAFSSKHCA